MPAPDIVRKSIRQWEGEIPYMYLDAEGYLTIGIGCRLFSLEQAQGLEFIYREDQEQKPGTAQKKKGGKASKEDIATDYREVNKHQELKTNPYSFKTITKLDLTSAALENLFAERVRGFEGKLRKTFPDYDSLPESAQLALLDITFNVGSISGFPSLIAAVKRRDWETAAKESHRKPKDPKLVKSFEKRNAWTADQLRKAADEEKAAKEHKSPSTKTIPRKVQTQPHTWYDPVFEIWENMVKNFRGILVRPRAQGRR